MMTPIDFAYAFAPPHRLTVALPDSSSKTLLDCYPDHLRIAWSDDDLTRVPLAAFVTPATRWELNVCSQVDGETFAATSWRRLERWLPALAFQCESGRVQLQIDVVGAETAAIARVRLDNRDDHPHQVRVVCECPGGWAGQLPAWIDPEWPADALLAGWKDRADRVLAFGLGAEKTPVEKPTAFCMEWTLAPGEERIGWLIRPYRAYEEDLPDLRERNWAQEFGAAVSAWRDLIGRAATVRLPPALRDAFHACLADLFIMREPVADGYVAAVPGTEMYRASSPFEPLLSAIAMDQVGLHDEAAEGTRMCLDLQEPGGNWSEPRGWAHHMWGGSGFKSWAAMEHYNLTGDRKFLEGVYPRMAASSRWQEKQRARTRVLVDGVMPLTYGLMPRGMGDAGLRDGEDLYGVFLPHNIWATFADRLTVDAARILGKEDDLRELEGLLAAAQRNLLSAMERGAIKEEGYRWIPGVPGKTTGSRWGVLNAAFPTGILEPDHELVSGTLRHMQSLLSPGGLPMNLGWMAEGMWVAIAVDNLSQALLIRGERDAALRYLYAALNHGTPLFTWCEERGPEGGTDACSGDRQHLWTPVAVVRFLRDALILDWNGVLHLAWGADPEWLADSHVVGVENAPSQHGPVSYEIHRASGRTSLPGFVKLHSDAAAGRVRLHLPLAPGESAASLQTDGIGRLDGDTIEWQDLGGTTRFEVTITRDEESVD